MLVPPVAAGTADMSIAVLPPQRTAGGGHGFVVRLARDGIARLTGWRATQPLSGMRCLTRAAFERASPLARGWGVEVGLTVDVLRAGLRIVEVPCELHHRVIRSGLARPAAPRPRSTATCGWPSRPAGCGGPRRWRPRSPAAPRRAVATADPAPPRP